MRSRCDGSMLAWTLNTKPENGASSGRGRAPSASARGSAAGTRSTTASSSMPHAEVGERRAEERRAWTAAPEEQLDVEVGADLVEQLDLVEGGVPRLALLGRGPLGVDDLLGGLGGAAGGPGEADEPPVAAVDDAAEVAGDADRPGDGA